MANNKIINFFTLLVATLFTQGLLLQKGLSQLSEAEASLREKYRFAIQDAALVELNKVIDLIQITPEKYPSAWNL